MADMNISKRFGCLAMEKGFITEDQFIKAMRIQISNEQKGVGHTLIGEIMKNMGIMNDEQVGEVIRDRLEFERYKCPNCGMLLRECPNCGTDLQKFH